MPYINVKLLEGNSEKVKSDLIKRLTDVTSEVLGKDPNYIWINIEELPRGNWGIAGKSLK
ncbi:MAG: tautomerase family protein [Candidatus Woesearchaeota archaeon]